MSIRGNSGLGGFSGIIVSTNLKGDYKPNFSDTDVITNKDNTPFFAGKINSDDKSSSAQYIGGIAGSVDNSSIEGFYVTPSLCGNRYVGGIAGSVNNTTSTTAQPIVAYLTTEVIAKPIRWVESSDIYPTTKRATTRIW